MTGLIEPPKFEGGGLWDFTYWMMKMEVFFDMNWDTMMVIKEPFEVLKDKKRKKFRPRYWIEEQTARSKANSKVISILIDILPNDMMSRVGKYENAHDLWSKVKKVQWEELMPTQEEEEKEKSEEMDVEAQVEEDQQEVEKCSTSEEENEYETSSTYSRVE